MMKKKPTGRPPRNPRATTSKPGARRLLVGTPKPKKTGPVVVLPNGSTVGLKDIGKVKPTPKPVKPKPLPTISDKEYFKRQKEYVDSMKKKK